MTRLRAHLFWMNGSLKATSGRAAAKQQNEDEENPGKAYEENVTQTARQSISNTRRRSKLRRWEDPTACR